MEKLSYKLEVFEGPLDMLLYLLAKHKLDIQDIPIAQLVDQYLEQMRAMEEENMDISSEFLEMAARLVYIKTVSLLPKHQEAQELQQELAGQLLEYQICKQAAARLSQQFTQDIFVRSPAAIEPDRTYRRQHAVWEILQAHQAALGKGKPLPPTPESFSPIVSHKIVSVASQIISVLRRLWKQKTIPYKKLFMEKRERSELVATFLAVLELVKGRRIRVEGESGNETIRMLERKR